MLLIGEEIVENTLEQERHEAARHGTKELADMIDFFWNTTIPQLCIYVFLWWIVYSILKNRPIFKKHRKWAFPVSVFIMLLVGFLFFKNNIIFSTIIKLFA